MTNRVKVLCGQDGKPLARIVDDPHVGTHYRTRLGPTLDPNTVFCPDHGWPNLASDKLAADLARARATGAVVTHRARMVRRIPDRDTYSETARVRLTPTGADPNH